jgi:NAD+ synthase (glutamine-hydrolysing)
MRYEPLRVALAQMNPTVGDIAGNAARIRDLSGRARDAGAGLVVFPELALTGYPPEDLLIKRHFLQAAAQALEEVAEATRGIVALVGFPDRADDVYNAAAVLCDGEVRAVYRKMYLPNYGVFDEQRYFQAGTEPALVELNGIALGLTICEDIWEPGAPATSEATAGAQVLVNLSASPYSAGRGLEREHMLVQRARDNLAAVLFCNQVGGQDELVFDGHSLAIGPDGQILARGPQFREALVLCTLDPGTVVARRLQDARHRAAVRRERELGGTPVATIARLRVERAEAREPAPVAGGANGALAIAEDEVTELLEPEAEIYEALLTGLRDYVEKNGFERVVFGLSGGIDSSLVALLAVDALGPERVTAVVMPSPYSSQETQEDARATARNLGCQLIELRIEEPMEAYERLLAETFRDQEDDITEENLQARIRGNLVMALSNKFGWLVLTTGNKSELSVGYATLYGDMAGGFAVLKDVFKGWVYRLVEWRNERRGGVGPEAWSSAAAGAARADEARELVPPSVVERPPSAELRYEQRDDESLPPYEILDGILLGYVEGDLDAGELVARGFPREDVERVIRMVDLAEYKRRQAPPGIRITPKAFGRDRRLPITNRFRA